MPIDQNSVKNDLLSLQPEDFYMKHIVKSRNWYFAEYLHIPNDELIDTIDRFKEIVSTMLNISFHSVQIVGSAKIGYSLSPRKLLKPFHDEDSEGKSSDIDIAIVSERLYQQYWDLLRKEKGIWNRVYYDDLVKQIYRGYINGSTLQKIDNVREKWNDMTDPVNKKLQFQLSIIHPITYRIYRYWDDLQDYQIYGIRVAKEKLGGM